MHGALSTSCCELIGLSCGTESVFRTQIERVQKAAMAMNVMKVLSAMESFAELSDEDLMEDTATSTSFTKRGSSDLTNQQRDMVTHYFDQIKNKETNMIAESGLVSLMKALGDVCGCVAWLCFEMDVRNHLVL